MLSFLRHRSGPPSGAKLSRYILLSLILLLALYYRVRRLGDDPFFHDQAATSLGAMQVARGERPLLGPMPLSFSNTLRDPPLPSYIYALPYAVSGDPRVARIFTAAWNLLPLVFAHNIARRYFGHRAGFLAALLYAVHPTAVIASRFVWNPNLAAPFVMLYLYTGLRGYYEGSRLAQTLHLPFLSLGIICHPAVALLAPLTPGLWWWRHRHTLNNSATRPSINKPAGFGILIAILIISPWIVGNLHLATAAPEPSAITIIPGMEQLHPPSIEPILHVVAGKGCAKHHCPMLSGDRPRLYLTHLLPIVTLASTIWILCLGVSRRAILPPMLIATALLLPPTLASLLGPVWYHYIWPLLGTAPLLQAASISTPRDISPPHSTRAPVQSTVSRTHNLIRWPLLAVILAILFGHLRFATLYDPREGLPSLKQNIAAIEYALNVANESRTDLLLQDYRPPDQLRCVGCSGWEALPSLLGYNLRVLPADSGIPIPNAGAYLMRAADHPGELHNTLGKPQTLTTWLHLLHIPPAQDLPLDIGSVSTYKFDNGAEVVGLIGSPPTELPATGSPWKAALVWKSGGAPHADYKFFAHLVDGEGVKYAQADPLALPSRYWRHGETVVSSLDFHLPDNLPNSVPLYLRFGMYDNDTLVPIIDKDGHPTADHGLIQLKGSRQPVLILDDTLSLDEFALVAEQPQGEPLRISTTWAFSDLSSDAYHTTWILANSDGKVVFTDRTNLVLRNSRAFSAATTFVRQIYQLRIPTEIPPGQYQLTLNIGTAPGSASTGQLTQKVNITPRNRSYDAPSPTNHLSEQFGSVFQLNGYDFHHNSSTLSLQLYWHALTQPPVDYTFFVHVWHQGEIVAQVDSMPASGSYPTSWWTKGEYYAQPVNISTSALAPGEYSITLGWYQSVNGARLPVTTPLRAHKEAEWITLNTFLLD